MIRVFLLVIAFGGPFIAQARVGFLNVQGWVTGFSENLERLRICPITDQGP